MANGGLIGPVKVICTPSTSTTSFTSSGTFTQTLSKTVEYLIVAGGGAGGGSNNQGGNRLGGGGGAGGLRGGSVSTTPQGYTITIGAGGSGVCLLYTSPSPRDS